MANDAGTAQPGTRSSSSGARATGQAIAAATMGTSRKKAGSGKRSMARPDDAQRAAAHGC